MAQQAEAIQTMTVKIFSPSVDYFDGEATMLSAVNKTGAFDVLPLHHNFITLLDQGNIRVIDDKNKEKIVEITVGLLHVKNNVVTVFLDV